MLRATSPIARLGALCLALASGACGGAPSTSPKTAAAAGDESLAAQVRSVVGEVVALRGLAELRPVVVRELDDATFEAAYAASARRDARKPSADVGKKAARWVLGFYDRHEKVVAVRAKLPDWTVRMRLSPRDLLAHEVTHALQDQHFGLPDPRKVQDEDRYRALQALFEGDAQLITTAYQAKRLGRPPRRAIAGTSASGALEPAALVRLGLFSPELLKTPLANQVLVTFPYADGASFAAALFRAGGFKLLDRAFKSPPTSSADILHPERYIAGLGRREVSALPAPPGYVPVHDMTFGEIGLATMFAECGRWDDVRRVTRGWMGDRTVILSTADAKGLVMATAWEDEPHARAFAAFARGCFKAEAAAGHDPETVVQDGVSVSIVSAMPQGAAEGHARRALAAIGPATKPAPPLGPVRLVGPPKPATTTKEASGALGPDGRWTSPYLGLSAKVPEGFTSELRHDSVNLLIKRFTPAGVTVGVIAVIPVSTTVNHEQLHEGVLEGMKSAGTARTSRLLGKDTVATPLGRLAATTWELSGGQGPLDVRALSVEHCKGQAVVQITQVWSPEDEAGQRALDAWLASVTKLADADRSPLCRRLEREAREDIP